MRPRTRELLFSWTGAALVLVILAALNGLARTFSARLDLSAGRAYSVSPGTKRLLGELEGDLLIKVFFTPDLPPPYGVNARYLRDLLEEYRDAGRGRVRLEFVNPEAGERGRREAIEAGVPPVQLNVMSRDKFEAKEAFMGAALLYRGRAEVLPVIERADDLEYDLTRRVRKLLSPKPRAVGLVVGHGERNHLGAPMRSIFEAIQEEMRLETVDLAKPVPDGVDALWVMGPLQPFKPAEVERLKAWVAAGRSLGLLLNRRQVDLSSFMSRPVETGLEPLLKSWGLSLGPGVVADLQSEKVQFETQVGPFTALRVQDYPFIPVSTSLDRSHPATRGLQAAAFPFAHPIFFEPAAAPGLSFKVLARSSPRSWEHRGAGLSPTEPLDKLKTGEAGPFALAGALEGLPGRVVLVSTAYQVQPGLAEKPGNASFVLNLLEWSIQDEALLSIRPKGPAFRPLRPLPAPLRSALKALLIFFLPSLLVAAGLLFHRREAARRRALRLAYGGEEAPRDKALEAAGLGS